MPSPQYINPYIAGSAVKGTEMFFGREDIFDFIHRNLVGPHSNNPIVLYGQRRTGKTSVLYQLQRRLGSEYWCVFIDLHGLNLDGMGNLMRGIASAISVNLRRDHQIMIEVPSQAAFKADPTSVFETMFFDQVLTALGDNQLVLMVDEAIRLDEEVRAGRLERGIFEYLRHLMQHSQHLNFVFSLGSGIEEMAKDYALLFNGSLYHRISFLKSQAARDLIMRPVQGNYQVTDQAVNRILQITSGHPYYTQLLCHCLFNAWVQNPSETVEADNIADVLAEAIELGSANLTYVWQDSTSEEQALMAGLAAAARNGEKTVTAEEIRDAWRRADVDVPLQEITRALRGLIAREVISGDDTYSFTVDLQRLWIDKHRRIGWVKDDLGEAIARWAMPAPEAHGNEQLDDRLAGDRSAAAEKPVPEAPAIKPYAFQGVQYRDRKSLAAAFVWSWDEAARRHFRPVGATAGIPSAWRALQAWLEQFRDADGQDVEALHALIDDQLLSPDLPPDVKLLILIQWLDPELPALYRGRALDRDRLTSLVQLIAFGNDAEPEISQIVTELHGHDLLPRLALMPGGDGFSEVNTCWQELDDRFRQLADAVGPGLPPDGRQLVTDVDNARRQAALLFLALDPQPHAVELQRRAADLLPVRIAWFGDLQAKLLVRPDPVNEALLLMLSPLAARDSAAADLARAEAEEASRQSREQWAEKERRRVAGKPGLSRTLRYSGVVAGVMIIMFVTSIIYRTATITWSALVSNIITGSMGIAVAAPIIASEIKLANRLGSDYLRYLPKWPRRALGRAFSHIRRPFRFFVFLVLSPFILGIFLFAFFLVPIIGYAVIGILHTQSWRKRRKTWIAYHEAERAQALGIIS